MTCDIFISCKNLNETGVPTRDAQLAGEVFNFLTSKGLDVFISTASLEDLGASDYKRAIDDALDNASIMIVVGTSAENLNSKWVRYEWDSFFVDMLSGVKPRGKVFAYVESLLPTQLPRGLRQSQTFIHSSDALQRLYSFVVQALRPEQPPAISMPSMPMPLDALPHRQRDVVIPSSPRPRVFLSYASEDAPYAMALSEVIAQAGFDVLPGKKRVAGDDWHRAIEREIQNCLFFVAIISENTEGSSEGYFRREWYLASERSLRMARPFVIPIVAGKLEVPKLIPEGFWRVRMTQMEEPTVPPLIVEFFRHHARQEGVTPR